MRKSKDLLDVLVVIFCVEVTGVRQGCILCVGVWMARRARALVWLNKVEKGCVWGLRCTWSMMA